MRRSPFFLAGLLALASTATAGELTRADLDQLLRELSPAPDEAWRTIPWRISLLDAQHAAASEEKPIFIWAMDGHPLGCT